jgi:hypothetical protein
MSIDEEKLRAYLLGSVSGDDEDSIGRRIIADPVFAADLERAEQELIEDHIESRLSPEESGAFARNFMVTPRRREMLREIRGLRAAAREASNSAEEQARSENGLFSSVRRHLIPAFAAAAVLVAAAAALIWFGLMLDRPSALESEYAQRNRLELSDPSSVNRYYAINLAPGNLRDGSGLPAHRRADIPETVMLRMALPIPEPDGAELPVEVKRAGETVFSTPAARVFTGPYGSELRFLAPASLLVPGQYQIVIPASDARFRGVIFQFRVE